MARNFLADLEGAFGGAVAAGREFARPVVAGGRYLVDAALGRQDASNAMDWATEAVVPISYDPSPEGRKAQREMIEGVLEPALTGYDANLGGIKTMVESDIVQAGAKGIADWWEGVDEDTKAGLEIGGAALDALNPALAAVPLLATTKRMGATDELSSALVDIMNSRRALQDYEKDVNFIQADTIDYSVDKRLGKRMKSGKYRGAPRSVDSPANLRKMRKELTRLLDEGAPGRLWYDESTQAANELTGGAGVNPRKKKLSAGTTAITSRGASVPANQVFGIKGNNQIMAGDPAHAGRFPNVQGEAIDQLGSGQPYLGGNKETPFYEGLTLDERARGVRPTNDLWMARAFDYTKENPRFKAGEGIQFKDPKTGKMVDEPEYELWAEGLSESQHRFMDNELNALVDVANKAKIGGVDDWTPERVQAAIWVAKKSEMEGTTVGKASENFADNLDKLTATVRYESTPDTTLDHMRGISGEDEYQNLQDAFLQTPTGEDRIALDIGALTRPSERSYGEYNGKVSPSSGSRVMAAPVTGGSRIDPSSEKLVNATAIGHGLLKGQETAGTTYLRPPDVNIRDREFFKAPTKRRGEYAPGNTPQYSPGDWVQTKQTDKKGNPIFAPGLRGNTVKNAAVVDMGSVPGKAEIADINNALKAEFGEGVFAVHRGNGVEILNESDVTTKEFQKRLKKVTGKNKVEFKYNSGSLLGNTNFDGFKPSEWLKEADKLELGEDAGKRFDSMLSANADMLNRVDQSLEQHLPDAGVRDEVLTKTREILATKGLKGLATAVEKGILPTLVLGVVGAQLMQAPQTGDEQS